MAGLFRAVNPRTGEELDPPYGEMVADEVSKAASLAWEAFPIYRHTDSELRASFLETIAGEIERVSKVLSERVQAKLG